MKRATITALTVASGVLLASAVHAGTPSAQMLANTCAGCHGPNGISNGPAIPNLASISRDYFIDAMKAYAANERAASIMGRIARGYSDNEIKSMAGYFSALKFTSAKQKFNAAQAKKGSKLHKKYCEKCHEDGGRSSEDDAGILAGQWKPYLKYTMQDFLAGKRAMPKKMKKRVDKMVKEKGKNSLAIVNEFYASQK